MVVDLEVKANAEEDWVDLVKLKEVAGARHLSVPIYSLSLLPLLIAL
jgi:hypothetical protein